MVSGEEAGANAAADTSGSDTYMQLSAASVSGGVSGPLPRSSLGSVSDAPPPPPPPASEAEAEHHYSTVQEEMLAPPKSAAKSSLNRITDAAPDSSPTQAPTPTPASTALLRPEHKSRAVSEVQFTAPTGHALHSSEQPHKTQESSAATATATATTTSGGESESDAPFHKRYFGGLCSALIDGPGIYYIGLLSVVSVVCCLLLCCAVRCT